MTPDGVFEVRGADARGPYSGHAVLAQGQVHRLVRWDAPLSDGRALWAAWHGTHDGAVATYRLRQERVISALGADRVDTASSPEVVVVTRAERWTPTAAPAPEIPARAVTWLDFDDGAAGPLPDWTLARLFWTYRLVAPRTADRARYRMPVDRTGRAWLARHPDAVLLVDAPADPFSVRAARLRADAFGRPLAEKARRFQDDMQPDRVAMGGDGALYVGTWVASQVYRWRLTREPPALAAVQAGVATLCALVEAPGDPSAFARAIARPADRPEWPARNGVAWLPGGNNDMLHGIEYGFLAASTILSEGQLRQRAAAACRSLLDHCPIARRGTHALILSAALDRLAPSEDTAARLVQAAERAWIDRHWVAAGNGLVHLRGITDWSGHHLAAVTFSCLRLMAEAPREAEREWIAAGRAGVLAGWRRMRVARETLLAILASEVGGVGAASDARALLQEFPYPKGSSGDGAVVIDRLVDPAVAMSPIPSLPWKLDWLTNAGRQQVLDGVPLFYHAEGDNLFNDNPFSRGWSFPREPDPGPDYLHAYWLARRAGVLGP